MAITEQITKLDTYHKYLERIDVKPSKKLDRVFACGLPAVWLYLKAIGLEELYFDLLKGAKNRINEFKDLFYLLILSNGKNRFFPHLQENFLKIDMPDNIAEAVVEVDNPAFEMAYNFTREQLREVLENVAKSGYMVRLGDQRKAIGIMYADNAYHVYHADNPRALGFKSLDGCLDLIERVMKQNKEKRFALVVQATRLKRLKIGARLEHTASKFYKQFIRQDFAPEHKPKGP